MHQMGLAEADAAIEEQRVEGHGARLGDALGGGMGELVGLADDEILEGEARIERRAHILRGEGGGGVGARGSASAPPARFRPRALPASARPSARMRSDRSACWAFIAWGRLPSTTNSMLRTSGLAACQRARMRSA